MKQALARNLRSDKYRFDCGEALLIHTVKQHKGTFYTSLCGDYHVVRESIFYGVGLMYTDPEKNASTVADIIRKVCALADKDECSRTYGVWPLYMEEPVQERECPDWNWSDFCAKGLLQFIIDYSAYFDSDLLEEIRQTLLCAAKAIMKRDVNPSYTNISIMGSYVTLAVGEYFQEREITQYAKGRFQKLFAYNMRNGCVSEYNSPTYTIEALTDLSLIRKHIKDCKIRRMTDMLLDMQWKYTMEHFCAENGQWTGPHSRCYETIQENRLLSFLQVGLGERIKIIADDKLALEPLWLQSGMEIPAQYIAYAKVRGIKSFFRHDVLRDEINIRASLWRDDERSLGSFDFCDFWTQRRPLIAYWGTKKPRYMRLRLMHDDFDFTSGLLKAVQIQNVAVGAAVLCNDHGDRHFNLDLIRNQQITAKYLALRFELAGEDILEDFEGMEQTESEILLSFQNVLIPIKIGRRAFKDICPEIRLTREKERIALDIIWHQSVCPQAVTIKDREKAFTAFAVGIFQKEEEKEAREMLGRISQSSGAITYDSGYSTHTVEYSEEICAYKEMVKKLTVKEKHCAVPSRHVWRVPSREDFGES